jgi:hypothetical protein
MKNASPVAAIPARSAFLSGKPFRIGRGPIYEHRPLSNIARAYTAVIDRRYGRMLLILSLAFTLSACAQKLTQENLDKVHSGMTVDEVKSVLGSPTDIESANMLGFKSTTFVYHTKSADVKVTFLNDKVMACEGEFK